MNDPTPTTNLARDALIGRERIRGATRMIAEGTDAASVTEEQIKIVAADAETFIRAHKGLNKTVVAKAIGYSPGVVVEFLKGTYKGNVGEVAIQLDSWLVEEEQRRSRPATTQFVWSGVAQEIKATANYCIDERNIGLVYSPDSSGFGKTTAAQAIAQELGPRRCAMITIDKVDANPTGLLVKICKALGKNDNGSNRNRHERILEELKGRSFLLIVDQIHNLRWAKQDKPLYHLCDIYDATKTAQLWIGTADMVAYLERQKSREADESLAQVMRRIFPRVDLLASVGAGGEDGGEPLWTIDQVREAFAKNKLKLTSSAARFICRLCNVPDSGGIGLCVELVKYATMMAGVKRLPSIDVPLLEEALRRCLTTGRSKVQAMAKEELTPLRAAKVG